MSDSPYQIPLCQANPGQPENHPAFATALNQGLGPGEGPVAEFERKVAAICDVRFGVATQSETAAHHLALQLAGVQSGDLVLLSNFSPIAPAQAISYLGAQPLLVEPDPVSWQMDLVQLADFLEKETEAHDRGRRMRSDGRVVRAMVYGQVLGFSQDPDKVLALAQQFGLQLLVDASDALGSQWKGKALGSFGDFGVLAFGPEKMITCGNGGMVLTNDPWLAGRARHFAGQARRHPEEYLYDDLGYDYRMPGWNAALGLSQLERLPEFLQAKTDISDRYRSAFASVADLRWPDFDPECLSPNHCLPTLHHPSARMLEEILHVHGIQSRKLWIPLDRLPPYQECRVVGQAGVAHELYEGSLSLPCSVALNREELEMVVETVLKTLGQ